MTPLEIALLEQSRAQMTHQPRQGQPFGALGEFLGGIPGALERYGSDLYHSHQKELQDLRDPFPQGWLPRPDQLGDMPPVDPTETMAMGMDLMPGLAGMTVWHGSPHKWDRPDISKVGTGEGAQAYGHGFYTAESPGVAERYRDVLSEERRIPPDVAAIRVANNSDQYLKMLENPSSEYSELHEIAHNIKRIKKNKSAMALETLLDDVGIEKKILRKEIDNPFDPSEAEGHLSDYAKLNKLDDALREVTGTGHLYELDLPDSNIDKMLDWDMPLSDQPESVRKAIGGYLSDNALAGNPSGEKLYSEVTRFMQDYGPGGGMGQTIDGAQRHASEKLRSLGIPGIKYLDAGSRSTGEGTRNFVAFNPEIMEVLRRNGSVFK